MRALLLAASLGLTACADAPSSDQCDKLRDHLVQLQIQEAGGAPLTEAQQARLDGFTKRMKYMDTCTERTTRGLVECALAARSIEEARACDESKEDRAAQKSENSEAGSGS